MGNWFKTNLWGLIIGLVAGSLATAAVLSAAAGAPMGAAPTPSASVLDARYPAAKTEAQVSLFAASQKACDDINAIGAKFTFADDGYEILAGYKDSTMAAVTGYVLYSPTGDIRAQGVYNDAPPVPCMPAELNQQVIRGNNNLAVEFLADYVQSDNSFEWHSHNGSSDLSNITLSLGGGGTIVGYTNFQSGVPGTEYVKQIDYGLTKDQLALVRK
jgi:hypothetical protein